MFKILFSTSETPLLEVLVKRSNNIYESEFLMKKQTRALRVQYFCIVTMIFKILFSTFRIPLLEVLMNRCNDIYESECL